MKVPGEDSLRYASKEDWSTIAKRLKPVHIAPSEVAAPDAFMP
jgi:hypothetical protein